MESHREKVLNALKALIKAALPNADVARNGDEDRIGPGGSANIHDGDPGEPDVLLSPLSYTYSHRIPVDVATYESPTKSREAVLDEMLAAVGLAIEADRTLGGLCEWLEPEAPITDDADPFGSQPLRWTSLGVLAVYTTKNPLT